MSDTPNSTTVDTLNELTLFINDRIAGYQRAVAESQDAANRQYYQQLVQQSQGFVQALNGFAQRAGGEAVDATTAKGKVYRAYMDAKAALTGHNEANILGSNVQGEEWAIKAYQDALEGDKLSGDVRQAVERQYQTSQETYRKLQQMEKAASV